MDHKGKGKVADEKEKEIASNETSKGETVDSSSGKKKKDGKKKCIKKIVYYESDTSSSSPREDNDSSTTNKMLIKQNYSKTYFNYSRIPYNSNANLLFIPLCKPPHFDGDDYSWWSHKMRNHLFSLHTLGVVMLLRLECDVFWILRSPFAFAGVYFACEGS
jgi:hypothetical protein